MDFEYNKIINKIKLSDEERKTLQATNSILKRVEYELAKYKKEGCIIDDKFMSLKSYIGRYTDCLRYIFDFKVVDLSNIIPTEEELASTLAEYSEDYFGKNFTFTENRNKDNEKCLSDTNNLWIPVKSWKDLPKTSGIDILVSCKLDEDNWVIRTQYEKGKWNDQDVKFANAYMVIPEAYRER